MKPNPEYQGSYAEKREQFMAKPLRSSDNRTASDYEVYLLARIDALEMKVRELMIENKQLQNELNRGTL